MTVQHIDRGEAERSGGESRLLSLGHLVQYLHVAKSKSRLCHTVGLTAIADGYGNTFAQIGLHVYGKVLCFGCSREIGSRDQCFPSVLLHQYGVGFKVPFFYAGKVGGYIHGEYVCWISILWGQLEFQS